MSSFSQIYPQIKPSIVAIVSRVSYNPEFPEIIGTGFIVRQDGIIMTNAHVINAIERLPRHKSMPSHEWPAYIMYFHYIQSVGMIPLRLKIEGIVVLGRDKPVEGYHYGTDIPDLGFIHTHVKDLPTLKIASGLNLKEGDEVMLSGFPLGTDTLRAPGWLHQLSPTLQSGIIASILPFPCDNPHAILLNIMSLPGSSGSPVFNPSSGEVIGIVYGGMNEPTTLSFAIPAKIIFEILQKIDEIGEIKRADPSLYETINEIISKSEVKIHIPKTPSDILHPVSHDDIINPP